MTVFLLKAFWVPHLHVHRPRGVWLSLVEANYQRVRTERQSEDSFLPKAHHCLKVIREKCFSQVRALATVGWYGVRFSLSDAA